jgi:hypothetical protein
MKKQGTGNRELGIGEEASDPKPLWRRFGGPALILLCALVATLPQIVLGPSCGHDFDFHLVSWLDALNSWHHRIPYPRWAPSPNFEAGEPRFIFYPPLTWMAGALLGAVLPWKMVPPAMVFLLFAATGLATRALARQAFNNGVATLAGCAAVFSGYALFTAYERSAFAEMTGGFWVPILLLLVLREYRASSPSANRPGVPRISGRFFPRDVGSHEPPPASLLTIDRTALLLSLVVAGAWLSNAPLGVMLSYLLAAMAIVVALLDRSWIPILRAAVGAALGLGLAAFFLIPAAWEQRWVAIRQAVDDPGLLIENSWLFARHPDPRLELHDVELIRVSAIGVSMVLLAMAGLGVSWWRHTLPAGRRWWIPLALIPVAVLFLQFPASDFLWNALPKMRFLQFPWRWLVVLEAPMAIFFASALWAGRRAWRTLAAAACVLFFLAATAFAFVSLFQGCDEDDRVNGVVRDYQAETGFQGTDEYAPPRADDSLVASGLPFACLVSDPAITLGQGDPDMTPDWWPEQGTCDATWSVDRKKESPEHLRLQADMPHAGYLVLRLRTYPAWHVRVNGQGVSSLPEREDGLMAVPVPHGPVALTADWTTTPDVIAGRLVSAVALALVTALWWLQRRRMQGQLS